MNRRTFLKRFGITIPVVAFAPKVALDIYEKIKTAQETVFFPPPPAVPMYYGELTSKDNYLIDLLNKAQYQLKLQMEEDMNKNLWRI